MIADLPTDGILPSPYQKRRHFDEGKLQELAKSIKRDGLIEPIVVRVKDDCYELIAGERRLRATRIAGQPTILARVVEATDAQARRMCAAENLQRDDLSAVEQVEATVDMVDAELIDDAEYAVVSTTPVDRVKWLLGRLAAVEDSKGRGYEVKPHALDTYNKFVISVGRIFDTLPRPVDWRSFYNHDLLLITKLDPTVQEWAIALKLNKSQAEALNNVFVASPAKFEAMVNEGATLFTTAGAETVPVQDMSARELNRIARDEKARAEPPVIQLIHIDPPPTPTVHPGEWWQLGDHLLYCGDTSEPAFVDILPAAAFVFADPPYNAGVAEWDNDFTWQHDWLLDKAPIAAVTPGIISIPDFYRITTMRHAWGIACWIDNGMTRGAIGFGNWIYVGLFAREGVSLYRQRQDIIRVSINAADTGATDHKGRKPTELLSALLTLFTQENDTVIDPFLGSGTTLLVAEKMGRRCIGGEIDPTHCTQIVARWEATTSRKARRVTNGINAVLAI